MGEQVEALRHHADARAHAADRRFGILHPPAVLDVRKDRRTVEQDRALVDLLEVVDHPQQRALARAARADDDHDLSAFDLEIDVPQHMQRPEALVTPSSRIMAGLRARRREAASDAASGRHAGVVRHGFQPRLEMIDDGGTRPAHGKVEQRNQRKDGDVLEGGRSEQLSFEHQLADGQDRQQRGVLEQADKDVADRRDDDADRLRDDDDAHDPGARHADRQSGLGLAAIDGLDAGAVDLGEVGGIGGAHADDAGCPWVQPDARERQDVIEIEQLQQHRRAAQHLDVDRGGIAQPAAARHPGQRHGQCDHQSERHDHEGGEHRDAQPPQQIGSSPGMSAG